MYSTIAMIAVFFAGVALTNLSASRDVAKVEYIPVLPAVAAPQPQPAHVTVSIAGLDIVKPAVVEHKEVRRLTDSELQCLYKNAFYEAGVSTHEDKIGVVQVTFNRLESGRWGNDLCGVVYWRAQFSWTLTPKHRRAPMEGPLWRASVRAVHDYLNGYEIPELRDSLFYHATWMKNKPRWADERYALAVVGQHRHYSTDRKR